MKICVINMPFSEEKAALFSKIFTNKVPLFDFINSFFDFISYGYQIIDGKINIKKIIDKFNSSFLSICYDDEDKVALTFGKCCIEISDITFEKVM